MIDAGPGDAAASVVVLAGLLRLRAGRCAGAPERVDALAGELAVVLAEAWRGELRMDSSRRLANVMADRAWGRVRAAERKGRWLHTEPIETRRAEKAAVVPGPEDQVATAVTVRALHDRLHEPEVPAPVARAWDTVVELADRDERSQADRNRWQYARRVLRRHVTADLEVVDLM